MDELNFEYTVRLFLGRKAEHIAGQAHDPRLRRRWLEKVLRVVAAKLDEVDTTIQHKQALLGSVEACRDALKDSASNPWKLIYRLLWLLGTILGRRGIRGAQCHSLAYFRDADQFYTSVILEGGDPMQRYYDEKNVEALRAQVASSLASRGHDAFRIAMILNTTEYRVKQFLKSQGAGEASKGVEPAVPPLDHGDVRGG